MNAIRPRAGSSIAVFGAGAVGLSALMAAGACGCHPVIAVEPNQQRRTLALEVGASHGIDPNETDPVDAVRDLTHGGVDSAIEAAGIPTVLAQATRSLASGGVCVLLGCHPTGARIPLDVMELDNVSIRGCALGGGIPNELTATLLHLHAAGRLPWDRMIERYEFKDINKALDDAARGAAIKPVVMMPELTV